MSDTDYTAPTWDTTTYKLVPIAEWEALRQARADRDVLAIEVRRLWSWAKKGATTWTPRVSQALDRAGGGA